MRSSRGLAGVAALALLALAASAGCSSGGGRASLPGTSSSPAHPSTPTASPIVRPAAAPCGRPAAPPVRHVIWIWMENREYGAVLGSAHDALRLSSYAAKCGLATNYQAVTHPSLPNYLAATSGSTGGVTSDCSPAQCPQYRPSIFTQITTAGLQWRAYAEAMPTACNTTAQGRYATKHNPAVYFVPIRSQCESWDVPMGGADGPFATALRTRTLAAFTFVEPDLCDDGHDCATVFADKWLGAMIDRITGSPSYGAGDVAVFVTWDEGVGADQHVATVVIAPGVKRGTKSGTPFTHYSLLRTTETLLGLPSLGAARTANDMSAAFGLKPARS